MISIQSTYFGAPVTIEVDLLRRLPRTIVVGMASYAGRETANQVRDRFGTDGYPRGLVVIAIHPADISRRTVDPAMVADIAAAVAKL